MGCIVLALLTIIQSLSAVSLDGGLLAMPTLYAIVRTSGRLHQLDSNTIIVIFAMILNVIVLAAIYFGVFHLLRWIFWKPRNS